MPCPSGHDLQGGPDRADGDRRLGALPGGHAPLREDSRYRGALELLKGSGFVLEPSNRKWWLRDRHKTLSFLAAHGERLRGSSGRASPPNFTARTAHLSAAEIVCEASPAGDGWTSRSAFARA